MVDWVLFIHRAEIAGVFVGFGALIAVRSAGMSDPHTVEYLRGTVNRPYVVLAGVDA